MAVFDQKVPELSGAIVPLNDEGCGQDGFDLMPPKMVIFLIYSRAYRNDPCFISYRVFTIKKEAETDLRTFPPFFQLFL